MPKEDDKTPRTFPLRVNQAWLNKIDEVRHHDESKHTFVLKAVEYYIEVRRRND